MSAYTEYFLNSPSSVVHLDTLEISHPNFTQTYWIVRNAVKGLTATLETAVSQEFTYYPCRITPLGSSDDLDQAMRIDLGDLGEVIPLEFDAVEAAGGFQTKPTVKYRAYRSDDLSAPLYGPLVLEVREFSFDREGASFEARAPSLNLTRVGEFYRLERFPMLRGVI